MCNQIVGVATPKPKYLKATVEKAAVVPSLPVMSLASLQPRSAQGPVCNGGEFEEETATSSGHSTDCSVFYCPEFASELRWLAHQNLDARDVPRYPLHNFIFSQFWEKCNVYFFFFYFSQI